MSEINYPEKIKIINKQGSIPAGTVMRKIKNNYVFEVVEDNKILKTFHYDLGLVTFGLNTGEIVPFESEEDDLATLVLKFKDGLIALGFTKKLSNNIAKKVTTILAERV